MNDILKELNTEQQAAVVHTNGPNMVIAGAGSGKTRVLTYKVAYLISQGVEPFRIMALTFTNKAANEMKERIMQLVHNQDARNVWMGTFHSIFARILRVDGHLLGFPSNFTIYDTDDSKSLIKSIVKELGLDTKTYTPSAILHRISMAKSNLISARDYAEDPELTTYDRVSQRPQTGQIYATYQQRLFKSACMDFDDILFFTNILLRDFPDVLFKYQQRFSHLLVDEYQDTNYSQYLILKRLAARHENICVVGDDAQSIYGFRGANIQNIFNFKKDYPDHILFKLEQNYRSTKTIVEAANTLIMHNKEQIFKKIWTDKEQGQRISLIKAATDSEEGILVAHAIFENKMNRQLPNSSFAILYRTNAQSRSFEESLRKLNIPYRIYGGLSFYKRKEIKDLLAYFRLVCNPHDQEALVRIINYPARGIGETTLEKLRVAASEKDKSMWETMLNLKADACGIAPGTAGKISDFIIKIRSYQAQLANTGAIDLAEHIAYTAGIIRELKEDQTPEGISRMENIQELLNAIRDFSDRPQETINEITGEITTTANPTLDRFLQEVSLLTDLDSDDDKENKDKVTLMTVHSAKGLEFPYVFVVGLEENLFPSYLSMNTRAELEEERRLFYVAITRAMDKLTLAWAMNRYRWGNLSFSQPSRFLDEIDPQCLESTQKVTAPLNTVRKLKPLPQEKQHADPPDFRPEDMQRIAVDMTVEHDRFGKGKVIALEGQGANRKATVAFDQAGKKQLLLRFAKLKILDE
ncbi:MAG TPA: 3'-5' exonuclease [Bacteroidales bacterium]|nr:3'-5' exonuclease [Bacteroidales bacterium]HSA44262.1 3'-5' exonuclease [Bacteroidales bacterium]